MAPPLAGRPHNPCAYKSGGTHAYDVAERVCWVIVVSQVAADPDEGIEEVVAMDTAGPAVLALVRSGTCCCC